MANYREYLSGMGDGLLSRPTPALDEQMNTGGRGISSGFFIDDSVKEPSAILGVGVEIPVAEWGETDILGNPPAKTSGIEIGFATYF